jgi:hypothetical protein
VKSIEIDFLNKKIVLKKFEKHWQPNVVDQSQHGSCEGLKKRNPSSDQRGICVFFMVRGVERIEGVVAVHPQRS